MIGNKIGRITTSGEIGEYPVPTPDSYPAGITAGPDGALWFAEYNAYKVGRITTSGTITEFAIPVQNGDEPYPYLITVGPDGALWFTESSIYGNQIGRITTSGVVTQYAVPTLQSNPEGIAAGPDGALWFTEHAANKIGRMTTSGEVTEYVLPSDIKHPYWIAAGQDGALWFTSHNHVGRITTSGTISAYPTTNPDFLTAISAGPDGALWFMVETPAAIGRAPACGLGFSASFSGGVLTMRFDLGNDRPSQFNILLHDSTGVSRPFSKDIPAVVPPHEFTMRWDLPDLGGVTMQAEFTDGPGQVVCSEWNGVNTAP